VFTECFEPDDLNGALDTSDGRWIARGGDAAFVRFSRQLRYVNWEGDRERFLQLKTEDFFVDDHRKLGVGRMNRDEYLATSFARGVRYSRVDVIDVSDHAALTRDRFVSPDRAEWEQLGVMSYQLDRFVSVDIFDLEDLDGARARFGQLAN
jgi:hypothetical protein